MDTFLEEEILEEIIDNEIEQLYSRMEKALVEYKLQDKKDAVYEILDRLKKLAELKVEIKVAKNIVRKHIQMNL